MPRAAMPSDTQGMHPFVVLERVKAYAKGSDRLRHQLAHIMNHQAAVHTAGQECPEWNLTIQTPSYGLAQLSIDRIDRIVRAEPEFECKREIPVRPLLYTTGGDPRIRAGHELTHFLEDRLGSWDVSPIEEAGDRVIGNAQVSARGEP